MTEMTIYKCIRARTVTFLQYKLDGEAGGEGPACVTLSVSSACVYRIHTTHTRGRRRNINKSNKFGFASRDGPRLLSKGRAQYY